MLMKRQRASRAIEGFNALLRPYRYVRKGVSQGFLELFKAWHNLRAQRSEKHKGTSAYEVLTGRPVGDWLTLLGFPPSTTLHWRSKITDFERTVQPWLSCRGTIAFVTMKNRYVIRA
jgi:hypothetical protein